MKLKLKLVLAPPLKKGLKLEDNTKTLISIKLGTKIHCYKMEANNLIHFKSFAATPFN
jgi:hypothetical protein